MMTPSIQPACLATYPSKSNPSKSHQVRIGADGNLYCTCPSWRFQKNSPTNRSCKHLVSFKASASGSHFNTTGPEPVAIRAKRALRRPAPQVVEARVEARDTIPCPPPAFETAESFVEPEWDSRPTAWEKLDKIG